MEAKRDQNNVPAILGVLNTNGQTVTAITANPTTKALSIDNNTTGSDSGPTRALRDENFVPTLLAVSNANGVTPVPLYVDATGKLLIDAT